MRYEMKGIKMTIRNEAERQMTYVTLRLKLPDDIDYAQKQIYHEDFRIKMTNVGLDLHLKNARGTTVIKNLQFSVGDKAAMFILGYNQIAETHETLRRIKIFTDAYCCLYDFVWSLNDITTTPDYSKKRQAFQMYMGIVPPVMMLN